MEGRGDGELMFYNAGVVAEKRSTTTINFTASAGFQSRGRGWRIAKRQGGNTDKEEMDPLVSCALA